MYSEYKSPSNLVRKIPFRALFLRPSDKSGYIKEPRLRGGDRRGKDGGSWKKKRPVCLMKLSFQRGLYATPLPYSISLRYTASDLTISYSSTPLEKLVKFASDTIVRLSRTSPVRYSKAGGCRRQHNVTLSLSFSLRKFTRLHS